MAIRGTILYFVISDLPLIDPMYQFSLGYFKKVFAASIAQADNNPDLKIRLKNLINNSTGLLFTDICRGLF